MNRLPKFLALAALSGALVIAGCGGDDEEPSSTTTPGVTGATGVSGSSLTKEQFIAQADEICGAGDETIDAAGTALGQAPTDAELETFASNVVVPSIQSQYDGIAALPVPEGEEENVENLLSALGSALDELEADPSVIADQAQSGEIFQAANDAADEFGLKKCGGD